MTQAGTRASALAAVGAGGGAGTRLWPFALVLFFATGPIAFHFTTPVVSQDEAVLLVHANQVLRGLVPHRDFFSPYGPASTYSVAAFFKILGPQYLAERLLGMLYHVLLAVGVQQATRSWGRGPACLAGSLCGLFLLPLQLVAFAWIAGLACLVWGVALMQKSSCSSVVMGAATAGLASAWRPELLLPALGVALILAPRRARTLAAFGLVVGVLPVCAHMMIAGGSFIENVLLGRLGLNAQHDLGDIPAFIWVAAALVCLETLSLVRAAVRSRERVDAALANLCVIILPQTAQRLDMEHAFYTLCVIAPLAVSQQLRTHRFWATSPSAAPPFARVAKLSTFAVAAGLTAHSVAALFLGPQHMVGDGPRALPVTDSREARLLKQVLTGVRKSSPAGTTIFVGTQDMSRPSLPDLRLYQLLPEFIARGYYLDLPPGVAERRGSGLERDIQNAGVLVLIATPPRGTPGYVTHAGHGAPDANAAANRFCTITENSVAEVRRPCQH